MNIVIVGNGIAGITAARHIRKRSDFSITVISSESEYFFSRTALMYIYMGHMKYEHTKPYEDWFWKKNNIDLLFDHVTGLNTADKLVTTAEGTELAYDKLILATGSVSNILDWPGIGLQGVQGFYSLQDLEKMEENTQNISHATVVGGGLIGVELAEMLHSRGIKVTFLVREDHFWDIVLPLDEAIILEQHILSHGIDLKLSTELKEIQGKERVERIVTSSGEIINTQFVAIAIGVTPNKELAEKSGIDTNRGILVNEFLETSVSDIFAIGDCSELRNPRSHRKSVEAVWYSGRMMGETLAATICGDPVAYKPGVWFNSAKFFDIEYQTYGIVPNQPDPTLSTFYWQNGEKCLRFNFNKSDHSLVGINALGIRLRHELANEWIESSASINQVISRIGELNFDPEFFSPYEAEIIKKFREDFPSIKVKMPQRKLFNRIFGG